MVTNEELEQAIWEYDKLVHGSINPDKVREYKEFIKPKLDEITNIKVIYPKNLFGVTNKPTEIIILTEDDKLMRGVIKKQCNIAYSFDIEKIDPEEIEMNYKEDNNDVGKNLGLDFSGNIKIIRDFIVKSQR
ncbi:hypothetical protein TthWC1_2578 [Thermoanaerobacter thermohydrosulfuricus WC1]|jgi:hypothetical protein|uniref:Uncharacterized protein n=2 Tax=Thermoanaerobacter TaxID=1754 RepID=D3T353_THEIA|nr:MULTISPECIES: hypothetical protein [Thermoanaerobacter]ADD02655.1 conserved hypothetical protein [Thermoanaerobacter italicus Ab9]EMT37948.1 hypothetical protein TthWC1_2578 [Thermoanaerobacter thermohydrosulfuricus WC1]